MQEKKKKKVVRFDVVEVPSAPSWAKKAIADKVSNSAKPPMIPITDTIANTDSNSNNIGMLKSSTAPGPAPSPIQSSNNRPNNQYRYQSAIEDQASVVSD